MSTNIQSKARVEQHFQGTYVKKVQIKDIMSSQPRFQGSWYRGMALVWYSGDLILLHIGHIGKAQLESDPSLG